MSRGRLLNEDDDYFIIANWETMTNLEMAKKLGVHQETVSKRGAKLGLINKKGLVSGNYRRIETSEQIVNYLDSAETIQELEARRKTLELIQLKEKLNINEKLKLKIINHNKKSPIKVLNGTIAQKNDYFIAVKLKNYVECFGYADFLTGKAVIM